MHMTSPCNCQTETKTKSVTERPRYYPGQLVTPDDLTLEQDYFRAKLRRHNRYMHGFGVVCGAQVVLASAPWKLIVKTGYVLGPCGDEIWIEKDQCLDVRNRCVTSETTPTPDDGCVEAEPQPPPESTLYVAVRYKEVQSRLVRVPLGGCGCDTNACEYTRYVDGYEICVLDHCPYPADGAPVFDGLMQGEPPDCLPAPAEPWVALAAFTVDLEGTIALRKCACRRQVLGLGGFFWTCNENDDA